MKTLQTQYNLIKEGKGHKDVFLKEAKLMFPKGIRKIANFDEASNELKRRGIISENYVDLQPINNISTPTPCSPVITPPNLTHVFNISGGKLGQINQATGMNTVGLLSQIGIMNPFSRTQESEADYLGMIFASLSGFDIRETKKLWERMKAENKGKEPPQFMSTHPSSSKRIKDLSEWENSVILDYPPITIS